MLTFASIDIGHHFYEITHVSYYANTLFLAQYCHFHAGLSLVILFVLLYRRFAKDIFKKLALIFVVVQSLFYLSYLAIMIFRGGSMVDLLSSGSKYAIILSICFYLTIIIPLLANVFQFITILKTTYEEPNSFSLKDIFLLIIDALLIITAFFCMYSPDTHHIVYPFIGGFGLLILLDLFLDKKENDKQFIVLIVIMLLVATWLFVRQMVNMIYNHLYYVESDWTFAILGIVLFYGYALFYIISETKKRKALKNPIENK